MTEKEPVFYSALCFVHGEFAFTEKPDNWKEMRCPVCGERMLKGAFPNEESPGTTKE